MNAQYSDIKHLVKTNGKIELCIDGFTFSLDLSFRHERVYAAKLLLDVRHPQSDIDELIIKHTIRPGDRCLDAGANVGFTAHAMFLAGASEVVSLEPVPSIYSRLCKLHGTGFHPIRRGIGAKFEKRPLFLSASHNQGSTISEAMVSVFPSVFGQKPEMIEVEITTVDDLVLQFGNFDVWKLDVEGAENSVLRGASATLEKNPPRIIFAEIYDEFRAEFLHVVAKTHPYSYRAFIDRKTYSLTLMDHDTPSSNKFHGTSPIYVFSLEALR